MIAAVGKNVNGYPPLRSCNAEKNRTPIIFEIRVLVHDISPV